MEATSVGPNLKISKLKNNIFILVHLKQEKHVDFLVTNGLKFKGDLKILLSRSICIKKKELEGQDQNF